jgi:hypothetical protein
MKIRTVRRRMRVITRHGNTEDNRKSEWGETSPSRPRSGSELKHAGTRKSQHYRLGCTGASPTATGNEQESSALGRSALVPATECVPRPQDKYSIQYVPTDTCSTIGRPLAAAGTRRPFSRARGEDPSSKEEEEEEEDDDHRAGPAEAAAASLALVRRCRRPQEEPSGMMRR